MENQGLIIALITALTSGAAWKFWEGRIKAKEAEKQIAHQDDYAYRDDLKARVQRLEDLLTESNEKVLALTAEVHALRTEVHFLTKENERLKNL